MKTTIAIWVVVVAVVVAVSPVVQALSRRLGRSHPPLSPKVPR